MYLYPWDELSWRSKTEPITQPISEPEIIGYYSIDGQRNYLANSSNMSYYKPPELGRVYMDLNQGIESAVSTNRVSENGSMCDTLEWVGRNGTKILASQTDKWIKPKFVTSGGVLTRILYTPYKPDTDWIICAAKLKGTIYLCRFWTEQEKDLQTRMPRHYTSWGYKFEQYMVSDHPDKKPDTFRPVIEPAEFRCIFKRHFGKHEVNTFSAEMDAVCSKTVLNDPLPLKKLKFIELKTKKTISRDAQMRTFHRHSTLQWWAQNFCTGIEEILCGFRDDDGIVRSLKLYSCDQLIQLGEPYWNPATCKKFCQNFLDYVDRTVVEDFDKVIYKFEKKLQGGITLTREEPTSSYAFLPSSFIAKTS
ncbi:decapping and exoribonuclease protein-like [Venturia canescens]|uniref:decapping and exoribonuclease protein-like n=1 Tax=Venturia canescens TaxID=32260 RepID=UPI001C9C4655|nr:decapping and exoribonuclease protein-like [Venturia canescens]